MYMEWKNSMWTNKKFIILDANLYFFPIFELLSSISGKIENKAATRINNSLLSISNILIDINETRKPNARWV